MGANNTEAGFNWPRTFLLGFGFLGVSVIWSLYNAYIPVLLKDTFVLSSTAIGSVMTIDNVLAILLLPFLGALSDRTRTPLGRRRPYILVGSILAAVFFVLVPTALASRILGVTMLAIILLNLSMALFRSPVIALMPDITAPRRRSQANGIINFVGGIVMLVSCLVVVLFIREPPVAGALIDWLGYPSPMVFASVMFAVAAVIVSFVRRGDVERKPAAS